MCAELASMAAFNKLGSLLRHNALTGLSSVAMSPAVFNAARLMSTKLFVGGEFLLPSSVCACTNVYAASFGLCFLCSILLLGLAWATDDQSLKDAFSGFGEVTEGQ
jgi:hypothetical protein